VAGNWVSIHRKLLRHPIMTHDGLCRLWIYCLIRANWKPKEWIVPGTLTPIVIERGSFITGRESLFDSMYPSRDVDGKAIKRDWTPTSRTVWRWLHTLQSFDCVKLNNVSNRCTLVTICNYDVYQTEKRRTRPADRPTGVPPIGPPVSTIEQGNNKLTSKTKSEAAIAATSKESSKDVRAEDLPLPEALDSPEFISARDAWFAMRRRRRFSVRPEYVSGWYAKLLPLGPQRAAECLRHSADNEYQGVFPEKFSNGSNGSNRGAANRPTNTGTAAGTSGRGDM